MDQTTLDRLMIDDALGALDPDVHALLAAYVQTVPAADGELSRWRGLAEQAASALAPPAAAIPPAFPRGPFHAARLRRMAWQAASVAAILAIGFGIGLSQRRSPGAKSLAVMAPPPTAQAAGEHATPQGFWSSQRVLAAALEPKPPASEYPWSWGIKPTKPGDIQ